MGGLLAWCSRRTRKKMRARCAAQDVSNNRENSRLPRKISHVLQCSRKHVRDCFAGEGVPRLELAKTAHANPFHLLHRDAHRAAERERAEARRDESDTIKKIQKELEVTKLTILDGATRRNARGQGCAAAIHMPNITNRPVFITLAPFFNSFFVPLLRRRLS